MTEVMMTERLSDDDIARLREAHADYCEAMSVRSDDARAWLNGALRAMKSFADMAHEVLPLLLDDHARLRCECDAADRRIAELEAEGRLRQEQYDFNRMPAGGGRAAP